MKDEHVRILDYLPKGKSEVPMHKRKPMAQAIGEIYFSLLELTPREGVLFESGDKVYIGEGTRDKVDHIERRIKYDWLTPTAKTELPYILKEIILENEEKSVDFFNTAGIISTRQHKLEVLPRIGKKHRQEILVEREIKPFKSFDDMKKRLKNVPDPVNIIVEKIVEELKGESKYLLFTPVIEKEPYKKSTWSRSR